jgi:hypothetical protein
MAKAKRAGDAATLQMALVGYEVEKQSVENKIREIHSLLGGKRTRVVSSNGTAAPRAKRVLSSAARKRIAAAQKKRWAEYRTKKAQAS